MAAVGNHEVPGGHFEPTARVAVGCVDCRVCSFIPLFVRPFDSLQHDEYLATSLTPPPLIRSSTVAGVLQARSGKGGRAFTLFLRYLPALGAPLTVGALAAWLAGRLEEP